MHWHSMYIYLLIRYHCNIALVMLHFVNFDNFLTFPNHKKNSLGFAENISEWNWTYGCTDAVYLKNFHDSSDFCPMGFWYSIQICEISHQTFGPRHRNCPMCPMIFMNTADVVIARRKGVMPKAARPKGGLFRYHVKRIHFTMQGFGFLSAILDEAKLKAGYYYGWGSAAII